MSTTGITLKTEHPKGHPARDEQDHLYNDTIPPEKPDFSGTGVPEKGICHPYDRAWQVFAPMRWMPPIPSFIRSRTGH